MSIDHSAIVAASRPSLEHIRFCAGGVGLMCPQSAARELASFTSIARVPNTAAWMRGLMNLRGALVPVVDLALAFQTTPAPEPAYALACSYAGDTVAVLVDALPMWCNVTPSDRLSRIPDCPAALRAHVLVAYYESDRVWFDIDIHGLLYALSATVGE